MPNKVTLDISKLKKIQRSLVKNFVANVGVLGSKDGRPNGSNATIGMLHEFGSASDKIPRRSFLRDPLEEKFPERLDEIGQAVFDGITEENVENFFEKLGVMGEEIVQDGFDSAGFGKWEPLKKSTIAKKGFPNILIETTQLRNSITSEVVEE